jgi:hypothetical protein
MHRSKLFVNDILNCKKLRPFILTQRMQRGKDRKEQQERIYPDPAYLVLLLFATFALLHPLR